MPRVVLVPSDSVEYRTRDAIFGVGINKRAIAAIADQAGLPRESMKNYKNRPLTIPWGRMASLVQRGIITPDDLVYMATGKRR